MGQKYKQQTKEQPECSVKHHHGGVVALSGILLANQTVAQAAARKIIGQSREYGYHGQKTEVGSAEQVGKNNVATKTDGRNDNAVEGAPHIYLAV